MRLADAVIAANYVASVADHYQHETDRPWHEIVDNVGEAVQHEIDARGVFTVTGETGAFVCG